MTPRPQDPSWNPSRGLAYSLRVMFDVRDVVDDVEGVVNDTVSTNFLARTTYLSVYDSAACQATPDPTSRLSRLLSLL